MLSSIFSRIEPGVCMERYNRDESGRLKKGEDVKILVFFERGLDGLGG